MKNIENLDSYRRIILEAVLTLKDANDILKNDKAVVLSAVKKYAGAFVFASDNLKSDYEFNLEIVKTNGSTLKYI